MPRPPSNQPTEVELQILKILWRLGPSTVRTVHDELTSDRDTNFSTTTKMFAIMVEKGLVSRSGERRQFIYRPAASKNKTQGRLIRQMIDRVFEGSASSLVLQALSAKNTSTEEIRQIRERLDQLEGDN